MADISASANQPKRKSSFRKSSNKLSTRIDLTPMVDLGFLLITFFLFTTTLAQPRIMQLAMPYKGPDVAADEWKAGQSMTLLLSRDHQVYYYDGQGDDPSRPPLVKVTTLHKDGIRQVIQDKISRVKVLQERQELHANNHAAFLIKADTNSTYDDFVRIMDEMNINQVRIKAVVDISPEDRTLIKTAAAYTNW